MTEERALRSQPDHLAAISWQGKPTVRARLKRLIQRLRRFCCAIVA